LVNLIS